MKLLKLTLTLFALFCLALSCNKGDKKNNNNASGTGSKQRISFSINGNNYTVTSGEAAVTECKAHIRDGNQYQLVATKGDDIDLYMKNQNVSGTGTYTINEGSPLNSTSWDNGTNIYTSINGKTPFVLNVTKVAGNNSDYVRLIEGTFSGVMYKVGNLNDSIIVEAGKIEIID